MNHGLRDPVAREYKFVITLASLLCIMYRNLYLYPVLELSRQGSSFAEGCEGHTQKRDIMDPSVSLSSAPSLPHPIPPPPPLFEEDNTPGLLSTSFASRGGTPLDRNAYDPSGR